jgi:hypothetical protein
VEKFTNFLGPYPVGTLVRLDSNEIGLVTWVGVSEQAELQVKILFDANGAMLEEPFQVELAGDEMNRIVGEVDPFVKGIKVTDYLA